MNLEDRNPRLVPAQHASHDAPNLELARSPDMYRLHRAVRRLQSPAFAVAVETLECRLAVHEGDHDLAVAGRVAGFDDDEVAVGDVVLDHRLTADAEEEAVVHV